MAYIPKLGPSEVEQIIRAGLPMAESVGMSIEAVTPGSALIRLRYSPWMVRPGGTVGGPVLMLAADTAMYAVVLAHIGNQPMALTSNLNINFLRRPKPTDVVAEGRLLKLGRRLAVVEVLMKSAGEDELVAHVTGTYALPG